ncbi:MAG: hypothetical protein PHC60_02085 [Heliobacteriaceae bacterium]|nr:hypothetical protein [Heliobacteriaceae bacterium]MDD4587167.1 hypothetical protein [Heliobacteriaceae bacterium]
MRDAKQYPYIIRLLDRTDVAALMHLQSCVLDTLEHKSFCVPLSLAEHHVILDGNGESLGLFIHNRLYAACSILFPGYREDNMARELNFGDEALPQVAQLELSLVHPDFRGNKLQERMAGMLARRAEQRKQCRYLFTTVSPYNYPSIETVMALGMYIAKLGKMYYQWDRYVVYKDFFHPVSLDVSTTIHVPGTCFAKQQGLLRDGFFGHSLYKDGENLMIKFAKRQKSYCPIK